MGSSSAFILLRIFLVYKLVPYLQLSFPVKENENLEVEVVFAVLSVSSCHSKQQMLTIEAELLSLSLIRMRNHTTIHILSTFSLLWP